MQLGSAARSLPTKRPSPWLMAIGVHVADCRMCCSQGLLFEATRVRTSMDWWRADRVERQRRARCVGDRTDLAVGHQAQLDERLEAVADAQQSGRRAGSADALTASVTDGLRKNAAMNLALPSGSSPPEKPPGRISICALVQRLRQRARTLSATLAGVRLFSTRTCPARAPARRNGAGRVVLAVRAGEYGDERPAAVARRTDGSHALVARGSHAPARGRTPPGLAGRGIPARACASHSSCRRARSMALPSASSV